MDEWGPRAPFHHHLTTPHLVPAVPVLWRGRAEGLVSTPASTVAACVVHSVRLCACRAEPSNAFSCLPVLLMTLGSEGYRASLFVCVLPP